MRELGELASQLGYWVVYRNWYGKVSFLIHRWDEQLPVCGQSFPTEEEALEFLAPISSQARRRLKLDDPSVKVERGPYGVSVTENANGGRTFGAGSDGSFLYRRPGRGCPHDRELGTPAISTETIPAEPPTEGTTEALDPSTIEVLPCMGQGGG